MPQSSLFFNALVEKDDPKKLMSASDWEIEGQVAIKMYLNPVNDPSKVLPSHCFVTAEGNLN